MPASSVPPDEPPTHVWYAAYGSNLSRERFVRYLEGGTVPGRTALRAHDGCRDSALPTANHPFRLALPLFFAGSSRSWDGGAVAFADPKPAPDALGARGRIWRITTEQFDDVFRQENGLDVPERSDTSLLVDWPRLLATGRLDVTDQWYGQVIVLGSGPDGSPVATFTIAEPDRVARGPAAAAYLRTIATGLGEAWGDDVSTAAAYLASCPGNDGALSSTDMAELLEAS